MKYLKLYVGIILYLFLNTGESIGAEMQSEFRSDNTGYFYKVTFHAQISNQDAAELLFSKDAVRYFSDFADSIHFTSIDTCSHVATMKFHKWLYQGLSKYRRELHGWDSLTIDLMRFEHNWTAIPQLKKASIRYYFFENDSGCTVVYQQQITVNKKAGWIYRNMAEWQLNQFAEKLTKYLQKSKFPQNRP